MHLNEYRALREAMDSLRAWFDMFASGSVETADGQRVRAMTFTDFLHSLVLAQFHVHSPVRRRRSRGLVCFFLVLTPLGLLRACVCASSRVRSTRATLWAMLMD